MSRTTATASQSNTVGDSIDTLWELGEIGAFSEEKCTARVLVRLGKGWFGALLTRQPQERTRHQYNYRVHLEEDQSTRSMKIPLEKYNSGDPEAVKGSWVLLEERSHHGKWMIIPSGLLVDRGGYRGPT